MSEALTETPSLLPLYARAVLGRTPRTTKSGVGTERISIADQSIDADNLRRYQQLCGYRVSDVLPPMYLHLLAFPLSIARMVRSDFPLPLLGLVHVGNQLRQVRPVGLGESVAVSVWADNLRPHASGIQVDLLSEASVDGEVVWTETSTYLRRGSSGGSKAPRDAAPSAAEGPTIRWRIPADIGRRYGAVSGDRNPIHLHDLTAKAFGFPKAIAHGMWLAARTVAAFEGRLPDSCAIDLAFKTPAFLPSEVELLAAPAGTGWNLDVRNVRSGKPHLAGTIR